MNERRVGRPIQCRSVQDLPKVTCFKPDGIRQKKLESVLLTVDELEAIRLADLLGLYQEEAAKQMNVSRPTFGRILEAARKKVAEAIVEGKQLCIQGGVIRSLCDSVPTDRPDICVCPDCSFELPHMKGEPCRETTCPQCGTGLTRKGGCLSGSPS
ncbi:MAG: DUF134 domain-containing protein [Chlorobiaceae bacterium]|nr:DUF134 domain-containing protein [Chlorobiaceae bacterium]